MNEESTILCHPGSTITEISQVISEFVWKNPQAKMIEISITIETSQGDSFVERYGTLHESAVRVRLETE